MDTWFNVINASLLFTGTKCAMERLEDEFVRGTFQIDFSPLQPAPRSRIPLQDINGPIRQDKQVPSKRKSSSQPTHKKKGKKTTDVPTGEILSVSEHGGHRGVTDTLIERETDTLIESGTAHLLPTTSSTDNSSPPSIIEDSRLSPGHDGQLLNDWWDDGCVDNNMLECLLKNQKELAEQQQLILRELRELREIKQKLAVTTFNCGTSHTHTHPLHQISSFCLCHYRSTYYTP